MCLPASFHGLSHDVATFCTWKSRFLFLCDDVMNSRDEQRVCWTVFGASHMSAVVAEHFWHLSFIHLSSVCGFSRVSTTCAPLSTDPSAGSKCGRCRSALDENTE